MRLVRTSATRLGIWDGRLKVRKIDVSDRTSVVNSLAHGATRLERVANKRGSIRTPRRLGSNLPWNTVRIRCRLFSVLIGLRLLL